MNAPPELILASADACMRMLNARDHERDAARREYEHLERQIASFTKITQPTGHVPLGMSPQDLIR
jgi:hypothetical protein